MAKEQAIRREKRCIRSTMVPQTNADCKTGKQTTCTRKLTGHWRGVRRAIEPVSLFASGDIEDTDLGSSQLWIGSRIISSLESPVIFFSKRQPLHWTTQPHKSKQSNHYKITGMKSLNEFTSHQLHRNKFSFRCVCLNIQYPNPRARYCFRKKHAMPLSWGRCQRFLGTNPDIPILFLLVHSPILDDFIPPKPFLRLMF